MRTISTEDIKNMRDARTSDRKRLENAPANVRNTNEAYIKILNEVLEYREAEEASGNGVFANFTIPIMGTIQ